MARVILITLILLVAADHIMAHGKYTSAALRVSSQVLHHFGVL